VLELVESTFPESFGTLAGFDLPASAADAEALWQHVLVHCLPFFGPFEDAISLDKPDLFHTKLSAAINLGRLLPKRLVEQVQERQRAGQLPLASAEGFIRQLLGWREFVRHVHEATDGFRSIEASGAPSALAASEPLPAVYWGKAPSGLRCLDHVVENVWQEGYSHHITRLMVLANIATLLGVRPRELCDWFWFAYVDAFDWVVEPNVLAMGTFGDGGLMTTKPYVAGAGYLHKMSDACGGCQFDPSGKGATPCPLTPMYWAFLQRNQSRLFGNDRMKLPLAAAARRTPAQNAHDQAVTAAVLAVLREGQKLPADLVKKAQTV
jgi:deoxyribodipyrimidine photolyase-related protein